MEQSENTENSANDKKFQWNKRYLMISFYAILVIFCATLIVKAVVSWGSTMAHLNGFIKILAPFIAGAFIAFILNPLVKRLDKDIFGRIKPIKKKAGIRKFLSILVAYIISLSIIVLIFVYVIPQIGKSITDLVLQIQNWFILANDWLINFEKENPQFDFDIINELISEYQPLLMDFSKNLVTNVVPLIFSTSISIVRVFLDALIAIMVSFYMISDKHILRKGFKKIIYASLPESTSDFVMTTLKECYNIFSKFVFGKAIDSFIIGCLCFMVMSILGLPYALIISLIVGVTNMIPYFGPFIGAVPGAVIIFIVSPLKALIFVVLIIVLQQFDGLFLGPRILGESVGLRPLWIIFAITVGGSLAGVLGMFLGVPVVAVLGYLLDQFLDYLVRKRNIDIEKKIN